MQVTLYDYWRSSAAYRVRIALGLLGIPYERVHVNLLAGEHRSEAYLAINPQGIVPTIRIDGRTYAQSLAIIEHLQALVPGARLLPREREGRARVRELSYAIAMEIHPVCNLRVATHVCELSGGGDATRRAWMQKFIRDGLVALEGMLRQAGAGEAFCVGDTPTMADCCLVPQLYNADRWDAAYGDLLRISAIAGRCRDIDAFADAHPDRVGPPPER